MASTIEIQNNANLDKLLMTNPDMQKKVTAIIRKVIKQARTELIGRAGAAIPHDPRKAHLAIRSSVYKAVLGGQVNILNPKRASGFGTYQKPRKLRPGQRGGNRIPRSQRTEQMDSYFGADRAFILRWLDAGTADRQSRYGSRGAIRPRRWFGSASTVALERASEQIDQLLDKLIQQELNE